MLHNWGFFTILVSVFFFFFCLSNSSDFHSLFWFCLGFAAVVISSGLFFFFALLLLLFGIGWRLGHPWSSKISIDCWMTQGNWCWKDFSCLIFVFASSLFTLSFLMINPKHRIQSSPIESHELFEFFSDVPVRAELEVLKRQKVASGSFCEFCLESWNSCGMGLRFWFYIRSFLFSSKFLNIWLLDSELQQILVFF